MQLPPYPYPAPYPYAPAGATPTNPDDPQINRALTVMWAIMIYFVAVVTIGLAWDRRWHTTHVFDTFYSPPHLFTYIMSALAGVATAVVVFTPRLRRWFGPGIRVPLFRFPVPAALFITGAGFVTLAIAGVLDDIWHTNFGLDETGWSTPHAMIGWGLLMVLFGFIACRLSLADRRPVSWFGAFMLSLLVLMASTTPFMGPMEKNLAPATMRLIAQIPILAAQPAAQHTYRIYIAANLTRTNPLFVPLAALWVGTMLTLLRSIDRRISVFLSAIAVWTVTNFFDNLTQVVGLNILANRTAQMTIPRGGALALPVPLIIAALVLVGLEVLRLNRYLAWGITGGIFGLLAAGTYAPGPWVLPVALASAGIVILGARLGAGIGAVLRDPAQGARPLFVFTGVLAPLAVGCIDLVLRHTIP